MTDQNEALQTKTRQSNKNYDEIPNDALYI